MSTFSILEDIDLASLAEKINAASPNVPQGNPVYAADRRLWVVLMGPASGGGGGSVTLANITDMTAYMRTVNSSTNAASDAQWVVYRSGGASPVDLTNPPTAADFNGLLAQLRTANVLGPSPA